MLEEEAGESQGQIGGAVVDHCSGGKAFASCFTTACLYFSVRGEVHTVSNDALFYLLYGF